MKRFLLSLTILSLFIIFNTNAQTDAAPINGQSKKSKTIHNKRTMPQEFAYNIGDSIANGNAGIIYFNNEFWVSKWASNEIIRLAPNGNYFSTFTIPGLTGTRSFTTDGVSIFAGNATDTIFAINPATQTIDSTIVINSSVGTRMVTYDPNANSGNGGFWIANFTSDIELVSRTGAILSTIPSGTHNVPAIYGGAIDTGAVGGPQLLLYSQGTNSESKIYFVDVATGLQTGHVYDTEIDFDHTQSGTANDIAGGLFLTNDYTIGQTTLMGILQGGPDMLFGYEYDYPNCPQPTNVTANYINATDIAIDWTSGGAAIWNIEYGPLGFIPGTGTKISNINSKPYIINTSTLPSGGPFEVYVEDSCGTNQVSFWAGPTPLCYFTAPYYNTFEDEALDLPPSCWAEYSSVAAAFVEVENFTGTAAPFKGSQALYIFNSTATSSSDTIMALSPNFPDLAAGDKRVRFFANSDDPATQLIIGTTADPNTITALNPIDTIIFPTPDTYQEVIVNFDAANGYNGTDTYIYLMHNLGASSDYIRIDEFYYEAIPSCLKPENLNVSSVTASSATVNWDEMNLATEWFIEYGPLGFTPGTGTRDTVSTNPATISGLNSDTDYEFYVISSCGRNDVSYRSYPHTFHTATILPFVENFESFGSSTAAIDQQGWHNITSSTLEWESNTSTATSSTGPEADHTIGTGGTFAFLESHGGSTGDSADLVSPYIFIDPSIGTVSLSFWYHKYGSTMNDLEVYIEAGGSSTLVTTIPGETHTDENDPWLNFSTYLTAYSGQTIRVRFRGFKGSGVYGDMAIDDVSLTEVLPNNAGVVDLTFPSLICPGTIAPIVRIRNSGSNTINAVDVISNINGVLDTVNYTGVILPNQTEDVTLNPFTFNIGTNYNIKFYTAFPNGNPDADNTDDTLSIPNAYTALTGNYTIDATIPASVTNYQSFNAAANDLHTYGVCGPVVFTVAPNTYVEQLTLNDIAGTSTINTVTFDGVDPSNTIISHDGSGTEPVILLDGTDYTTVTNLNIVNTGTSNSVGVLLTNEADYNTISNNIVEVYTGSTSSSNYGIVSSGSTTSGTTTGANASHTTIDGNHVIGGYYGIHLNGVSSDLDYGNYIINNIVDSVYFNGIHVSDLDSVVIKGNVVDMQARGNSSADGIWLNETMHFFVLSNTVNAPDYGIHAFDANSDFTPTQRAQVINNIVVSTGDYGIYLNDALDIDVFHNSVSAFGSTQDAFYVTGTATDRMDIRNNIFVSANAPAFDYNEPISTLLALDNNLYYSGGSNLIRFDGTNYADLNAFQTAHPTMNISSLQGDPLFVDPSSDLHILPGGLLANNVGDNSVNVTEDIDGEIRPIVGSTTVDIGADEFTPPAANLSPISLVPGNVICTGTSSPVLSVGNFGTDTITAFDVIYSVNGVSDTISFTGNILPLDSQNVTLGPISFSSSISYDLVFITANPNGGNDDLPADDTLSLLSMRTSLNGNYTIDPSQPASASNYQSFNAAANDLHAYGVCGPVVFNVAAGTYNEQLTLNEIEGSTSTNTIIFDGTDSTQVLLTHDGSIVRPTLFLDGTDYVTFTNMGIEAVGTSSVTAIHLMNQANHNTFSNNLIMVDATVTVNSVNGVLATTSLTSTSAEGDVTNFTTFNNNKFVGGYYQVRIEGSTGNFAKAIEFRNNEFNEGYDDAVYLDNVDSLIFIENDITSLRRSSSGAGLLTYNLMNFEIAKNYIVTPDYSIYISDANSDYTPSRRALIANNMLISEDSWGMLLFDAADLDIFHNTVEARGDDNAIRITNSLTNNVDLRNNIFISNTAEVMDYNNPASTVLNMDYNIYYSSGADLIEMDGIIYPDLAAFQAAHPTLNANSLEGLPSFVGPYDLHRVGNFGNNVGDNTVGIGVDFDGDPRPIGNDTVVDIGADEYEVPPVDVAVLNLTSPFTSNVNCYSTVEDIVVELSNLGIDSLDFTIDSVDVTVNISGAITQTLSYTVSNNSLNNGLPLPPVEILNVITGNVDMSTPGTYYFDINVNTTADGDPSNNNHLDTVVVSAPVGGSVISSVDTICTGDTVDLSLSGSIGGIQWQRLVGSSFADEIGATDLSYRLFVDTTTTFRALLCDTVVSDTFTVEVINLQAPTTMGDTVIVNCGDTGIAVLTASSTIGGLNFNWYDSPTSNNIISNNDTLFYEVYTTTSTPSQSRDTFYVSTSTGGGSANVGAPNNGQATGYTLEAGLFFDVFSPLTIDGVYVYPLGTGPGTVDIGVKETSTGNIIHTTTVNLTGSTPGVRTYVPLGFKMTVGTDYQLLMLAKSGGVSGLVRDGAAAITGTGFPFTLPGIISITQGQCCFPNDPATSYYYFYDWEISSGCESPRVAVVGEVECAVGIEANASISDLKIYPNPSTGIFNIVGNNIEEQLEVSIFNINGKMIYQLDQRVSNSFNKQIDLSGYSKGIYFVRFQKEDSVEMRKIIVQ